MKYLFILISVYIFVQLLLSHVFISKIIKKFSRGKLILKMKYGIFFLPLCFFYGKKVQFEMTKEFGMDEIVLELEQIFFFINPFKLFLGRMEIFFLNLINVKAIIISWISSQEKLQWLPHPNRVFLKKAFLKNGSLIYYEKSKFPHSKIEVQNIQFFNFSMDLAYPLQFFFFAKRGELQLGNGYVKTELCFPKQGFIKIYNVKWSDLINLSGITLQGIGGDINLHANFKHNEKKTLFRGVFGKKLKLNNLTNTKAERFAFQFFIDWEEFHLPLDLGLYNLFYLIFKNTVLSGMLQITVIPILDLLKNLFKQDDKNN